jgi:hypothetical protein
MWLWVLELISDLAIFTNAALLCFTLAVFDTWEVFHGSHVVPFLIVIFIAWVVRKACQLVVSPRPTEYLEIMQRHKYIVDKCIKGFAPIKRSYTKSSQNYIQKIY